jgi:hypothetical protein
MKTMVVPERLFIHVDRVKELMDNMGKIMITAYEVWKRDQSAKGNVKMYGKTPEQLMQLFINDISEQ